MPARERARAVQQAEAAAHLARGSRVWTTADVLTPAAWIRRECGRVAEHEPGRWPRILGSTEEWLLWREAAQEAAHELPVLDPGMLADSLQRASARAAAYGLTFGAAGAGSEADLCARAQRHFIARCRELDAASVSALMPRISELRAQRVLLRGFDSIPPALAPLTSAPAPTATALGAGAGAPWPPAAPRGLRPADAQAQMEAIAAWCCERLRADPEARLLVMLPGPHGERERLAALIAGALDPGAVLAGHGAVHTLAGIEGGERFATLPLAAQALLGLSALSGEELDTQEVSRWLVAAFWDALPVAPRANLASLLRERTSARMSLRELIGALQLAPEELQPVARELDSRLRRAAAQLGEGRVSTRRWAERFEAALAALGWPGPLPPESVLHRTRLRWRDLFEEFGELAGTLGEVPREIALELLRALAQRAGFRAADDDVPVTISPLLADPVVIYDGVWVAALSADVLPQPVTPDPFLSLRAQIEAGVPEASAAGRRAQARSLLAAWRAGARELVLCVPRREKDLELLPSACLADLELPDPQVQTLWLPQRLHREGCIERLEDRAGTAHDTRTLLPGGVRLLTLQSACPFRAYAELRLGATEETRPEPGIAMDQRGILLHTALELLWAQLRDSQSLAALEDPALLALIGACVQQAADSLPPWRRDRRRERRRARRAAGGQFDLFAVRSPALERECRRAERLIHRLCELERSRGPFTVEAIERATELALGGGRLRLRVDRVDSVADGRVVLDYKSGRLVPPDWLSERPTHPQLLAYASALGRDVVALATVNLTPREVRFSGVAATGGLLPKVGALPRAAAADWAAQQRSWEALIERLIGAFIAGDARVDPAPGACDHCHVTDVCRIGAYSSPESATAVDEADE